MQVEFSAIHPDHILPLWKKIAPLFERLVNEQGSDSLENIFDSLVIKQHNLLWMAWEKDNLDNILMVISTRLVEGGIFEILGCVGQDRYLWMNYFFTFDQYAKDNNCTRIMIKNGRKGWQRDLSKQGMKITGYTFEKNI